MLAIHRRLNFFPGSMRGLLLLLVLLVLLPVLVVQLALYAAWYNTRIETQLQSNLDIARASALAFRAYVDGVLRDEKAIGEALIEFDEHGVRDADEYLRMNAEEYPSIDSLHWINPEGRVVASSEPKAVGLTATDRSYYREIVGGREWVLSDLMESRLDRDVIFIISRAVRNTSGTLLGVVAARVDPLRLGEASLKTKYEDTMAILFFDSNGRLAYRNPQAGPKLTWNRIEEIRARNDALTPQALAGKEAKGHILSPVTGRKALAARVPIKGSGWVAGASTASEDALTPIYRHLAWALFFLAGSAVVAVLFAFFVNRKILHGFRALQDQAQRLGTNQEPVSTMRTGTAEFDRLSDAMRQAGEERYRAEQEVRRSEHWHRQLTESLPQLVWTCTPEGKCDYLNRQWVEYTGIPEQQQLGDGWIGQFHPEDRDRLAGAWTRSIRDGAQLDLECRLMGRDRVYRWFKTRGTPLRDLETRQVARWFGTCTDIHALKAAEDAIKQANRLRDAVLNSTHMLMACLDRDCNFVMVNRAYAEADGKQPDFFPGKNHCELYPDEDNERIFRQVVRTGEPHFVSAKPFRYKHAPERDISYWDWSLVPIKDDAGAVKLLALTLVNVTASKIAEQALRKAYEDLDARVAERTKEIAEMNLALQGEIAERTRAQVELAEAHDELEARVSQRTDELVHANAMLRSSAEERELLLRAERSAKEDTEKALAELESFSYTVSHDLKTPLRSIDAFSAMLDEECGLSLSAEGRRYLQVLRQNAKRMGALINDLLDLVRLGRQPVVKQWVNTQMLVQQVIRELNLECKSPSIAFVIGEIPPCEADITMLKQVFLNLVGNAIKYSSKREGAEVAVSARTEDGQTVFVVKDNGSGFNMKYVNQLFKPFHRLHADPEIEGTGIGLAIVHRIVTRHGGRVWAESSPGNGAAFSFTLGCGEDSSGEAHAPSANGAAMAVERR